MLNGRTDGFTVCGWRAGIAQPFIVTRLWDEVLKKSGFGFKARGRNFSLHNCIQTSCKVYLASCPMGTGYMKLTAVLDLIPEVKKSCRHISTTPYIFMAWCLIKQWQG
jgi:hypothetical protein